MLDRVCIICGERHSIYLLTYEGASLHQCLDCELIFRHPPQLSEQLGANSQSVIAIEMAHGEKEVTARHKKMLVNAEVFKGKAAVLGLSDQHPLIENLSQSGLEIEIVTEDANSWLEKSNTASYDSIVLLNIIEKCAEPQRFLERVRSVLKENGKLAVVFHSLESKQRFSTFETFWSLGNLYYFSHTTMQLLLEKSGFEKIWNATNELFVAHKNRVSTEQILSVIMPVYNEKDTFEMALNAVLQKKIKGIGSTEVIAVDNRSTDGTRELVKNYINSPNVKILFADEKQGKGYAVREGLKQVTGDIVMIQDADLEYDIDDLDALLEPLVRYKKAFVLGSRHKGKWKMRSFINDSFSASFLNAGQVFFTTLLNILYNQQMTDPLTMYKVFRKECLYGLKFECDGFDFDQELVAKFIRKGYTPHEIRVNYRSRSFSEGKKISMLKDPFICLINDLKYRFVSPFETDWKDSPPK